MASDDKTTSQNAPQTAPQAAPQINAPSASTPQVSATPLRTSLIQPPPSLLSASHPSSSTPPHASLESADAPRSPRWVKLCDAAEVAEVGLYPHEVTRGADPYPLLLIRTEGGLHALHDECPHRRIAISEMGYLEGEVVRCGWHHWGFHVENGEHIIPTGVCVDRFAVREEAGEVWVDLPWP